MAAAGGVLAGALADTATDPDRLCLEVTERALAANPASAATTLKRLSALGVRVSVDDFGTGYSSLASLQYLPLSSLKIDRSFVTRLDLDPADDAMVAAGQARPARLRLRQGPPARPPRDRLPGRRAPRPRPPLAVGRYPRGTRGRRLV